VGKEIFMEYAPVLIETMIVIQESSLEQIDPQKSYLLSGWQRLCLTMGDDFVPYLAKILPSLFKLLENIFSEPKPEADFVDSTKKEDINTFETEEVEVALNMLSVLIDEMKENFSPYVEIATKLILPLCNFTKNESIRTAASKCLPSLVSCVKNKEPQKVSNIVRLFLNVLWNSASSEFEAEVIVDQITSMKDCLNEVGVKFLANEEINEISQNLIKLLMESDKRKLENEKYKTEEEVDEEEIEMLNEDTSSEEDLQVAIAELIGVLFKTHKEMTLPLVELLYTQVLSKVLQPALSDKMHKFGIFLIDDMIEFLGLELIPDKWPHLSEALIKFSNDKSCPVRQAAVYGIGVLAEKSREIFAQMAPQCINALYESLKVPQGDEKNKVYGHCKDNTISALGKIIKSHHDKINLTEVIQIWLNSLPLKFDKPEAKVQHELLTDILLNNGQLVMGANGSNLPKIVKILAEVIDTKFCTPEIKNKIILVLNNFKANTVIIEHWNEVTAGLDEKLKKKIEDCMK